LERKRASVRLRILVERNFSRCASLLSHLHERLIQGDANQPCRELRILSELVQVLEGLHKSLLHHILGIFTVVGYMLSDSEESAIVSAHQLLESGSVSFLAGMDQFEIIDYRGRVLGLCAVFSHIRFPLSPMTCPSSNSRGVS
jgi:hypothetical protein